MIEVENDEENVTYEQPFHSHVYENQLELLLNYYTRPRSKNIPIDLEFKSIHQFSRVTISSIKYMKNSNSDIISLHVYNNSPYKITLPLGLIGYCETNATTSPTKEVAYRVNNILQLLDICQSTILDEELSINNIISNEKRNTAYFTKTPYFKPTF